MVLLFSSSSLVASSARFVCSNMCKSRIYRTYLDGMNAYYNRPIDRSIVTQRVQCASFYSLLLSPYQTVCMYTYIFQSCESHFRRAISHWIRKRFFYKNRTLKTVCVRTFAIACMCVCVVYTFWIWFRRWTNIVFSFIRLSFAKSRKKTLTEVIGPKIHAKLRIVLMDANTITKHTRNVIMSTETIFHLVDHSNERKEMKTERIVRPLKQQWFKSQEIQTEAYFIISRL